MFVYLYLCLWVVVSGELHFLNVGQRLCVFACVGSHGRGSRKEKSETPNECSSFGDRSFAYCLPMVTGCLARSRLTLKRSVFFGNLALSTRRETLSTTGSSLSTRCEREARAGVVCRVSSDGTGTEDQPESDAAV